MTPNIPRKCARRLTFCMTLPELDFLPGNLARGRRAASTTPVNYRVAIAWWLRRGPAQAVASGLKSGSRNRGRIGLALRRLAGSTGRRSYWEDMMTRDVQRDPESIISRRTLVQGLAIAAGATMVGAGSALAQQSSEAAPPTTITTPPRDFGPNGAPTTYFSDPDIIAVDPSFDDLAQPNTAIKRLYTGLLWAEGPAWSAQGRYLLWSDIPNNRQMRWSEDDGRVSVFRSPSNNSNGNSFDFQGRQLSCEHLTRRVVRYEHDGTSSVLADNFGGKKLNSPNDVVAHPDGSYWFTDPPYGGQLYEGEPDAAGGATNAVRGSGSRPASCRANGSCRPTATGSIPAAASTSWSPRTRCRIPTGWRSRLITRSCTSSVPAKGQAIPVRVARATCSCSMSAPTTSSPIRSGSATS